MKLRKFLSTLRNCVLVIAIMVTGCLFFSPPAHALLITGEYVFIGPGEGTGILAVKNMVNERRAFRLFWREVAMQENGRRKLLDSVEQAEAMGIKPASPYLYAAPRRMMVEPGQVQNIRFMVRRTENMEDGEYRSYIEIKPEDIPGTYQGRSMDVESSNPNVNLDLKMLTGVRLPVFVLQGNTTLDVRIENVRRGVNDNGKPVVTYTVYRDGTRSALGTVDLRCQKADGRTKYMGRSPLKIFADINVREYSRSFPVEEAAECVSSITVNFTPHKHDPAYNTLPMASAEVPAQ